MRTLVQLAHQIRDNISGGDVTVDSKLDPRNIMIYIRQAMNEVLKLEYYDKWKQGDRSPLTLYISTYSGLVLQEDTVERLLYITLPQGYISLPHNKGIYKIHPERDPQTEIIPSNNKYVADSLPAGNMEGRPSYWTEGLRTKFRPHTKLKKGYTMTAKLIIAAPDTIGETDILPMIPEQEAMVIDKVTERLTPSIQIPHDALNDGNKDIGVTTDGP